MRYTILFLFSVACWLTGFARGKARTDVDSTPPLQLRHNNSGLVTFFSGSGENARRLFNMMIPEYIKDNGRDAVPPNKMPVGGCFFHNQPSKWENLGKNQWRMSQDYPEYLKFEVVLTTTQDAVYLAWRIRNTKQKAIKTLTGD